MPTSESFVPAPRTLQSPGCAVRSSRQRSDNPRWPASEFSRQRSEQQGKVNAYTQYGNLGHFMGTLVVTHVGGLDGLR
jgi:hypothetical protein